MDRLGSWLKRQQTNRSLRRDLQCILLLIRGANPVSIGHRHKWRDHTQGGLAGVGADVECPQRGGIDTGGAGAGRLAASGAVTSGKDACDATGGAASSLSLPPSVSARQQPWSEV